jgi:hypothetical protein
LKMAAWRGRWRHRRIAAAFYQPACSGSTSWGRRRSVFHGDCGRGGVHGLLPAGARGPRCPRWSRSGTSRVDVVAARLTVRRAMRDLSAGEERDARAARNADW